MRISWFRPDPPIDDTQLDPMGVLVAALSDQHDIRVVSRASAHDEVWRWHRGLTDLCVYELTGTPGDAYAWPYLVRFPGLALVLGRQPAAAHGADLIRRSRGDDAGAEHGFVRDDEAGPLAIPLRCSRAVAVPAEAAVNLAAPDDVDRVLRFAPAMARPAVARAPRNGPLRVGLDARDPRACAVVDRAVTRARETGAHLVVVTATTATDVLAQADVVLSLQWPPSGACDGLRMAAAALGIPAIVLESPDTTALPCLDPQTWQSRDRGPEAPVPVGVSLDPRDEEHSLMLALRRLSEDGRLLDALGTAAEARWRQLHEPAAASAAFSPLLETARARAPLSLPAAWPAHFRADASGMAREILGDFGLAIDLFD